MVRRNASKLLLSDFSVSNLGPVPSFSAQKLGMINVFMGENACGKTYLMKMLYVACKAMESYKKGKKITPLADYVRDKIHWTFQTPGLADIVTRKKRRSAGNMQFACGTNSGERLCICVDMRGNVRVDEQEEPFCRAAAGKGANSVFLPAKEVLTSHGVIVSSRDDDGEFGFDDTYYDLAKVLQRPPTRGRNSDHLAAAREQINAIFDARASYDLDNKAWTIVRDKESYDVNEASEGIRKLSILDILLGNRYITPGSVVFIDEPESALHPRAVSQFMEAVYQMSRDHIQFFMATHSYFVIKKLENIARKHDVDIPVFSYQSPAGGGGDEWVAGNMRNGLPNNPIIRESVELYREDLERLF